MMVLDRLAAPFSARARMRAGLDLIRRGKGARGFRHLARAARRGSMEAQYRVGRCYLEGQAVPQSRTEAVRWLERAAQRGHTDAQLALAALCTQGAGYEIESAGSIAALFSQNRATEPDYDAAVRWAGLAVEGGSAKAQALLGYILTFGPPTLRDLRRAEQLYRRSASVGCPQGSLGLGLALLRAARDEAGQREAATEIRKAAAAGLGDAIYVLGAMTELGIGVTRDLAAAAELFRVAAEKGIRQGQSRWGLALLRGHGVERNLVAGESWLRRAANAGDAEAAALVGHLHARGGELPPNYAEAALWLRRAAEQGHAGASRMLAQLYLTGAGVAVDPKAAAHWLRRAADVGDKPSQADLGNLVLAGDVPPQTLEARQWFERAANAGDLVAAYNFAVSLAQGVGAERDDRGAMMWLRRAARSLPLAQYWYGRMLVEGRGLDADPAEGRVWLARATEAGVVDAQVMLGEMMVNGRGGPRDDDAALALFDKAARQGHAGAMFALGVLADGRRDVAGRTAAQDWFRQAAERDHPYAALMLGRYLARGLAGTTNLVESRRWLEAARAAGVTGAELDLVRGSAREAAPARANATAA